MAGLHNFALNIYETMRPAILTKPTIDLLVGLLAKERFAELAYLQIVEFCRYAGFDLAAEFYAAEAKDERKHALRHMGYLSGLNARFAVPTPTLDVAFTSLAQVEEFVFKMENDLRVDYSRAALFVFDTDQTTYRHLLRFVKIQKQAVEDCIRRLGILDGMDGATKFELLQTQSFLYGG